MNLRFGFLLSVLALALLVGTAQGASCARFSLAQRQWITLEDCEALDLDGNSITMECWINLPTPQNNIEYTICNKEMSYELHVRTGLFQVALRTNANLNWRWIGQNTQIQANRWYHVASTYDGQRICLYVNGEQRYTEAYSGNILPVDTAFYIGTRPLNNFIYCFEGRIDEFRLWDVARTAQEISDNMHFMMTGREEGLVGYWRLDEGEGQVVNNLTANEITGYFGDDPDEDARDPSWAASEAEIWGGELELSATSMPFCPLAVNETESVVLRLDNVSQENNEAFNVDFRFTDQNRPG